MQMRVTRCFSEMRILARSCAGKRKICVQFSHGVRLTEAGLERTRKSLRTLKPPVMKYSGAMWMHFRLGYSAISQYDWTGLLNLVVIRL
jgi:hypothetical protein